MKRIMPKRRPLTFASIWLLVLALVLGCRNNAEPLSCISILGLHGDPPLTGRWIQPGLDTWAELDLDQLGTALCGEFSLNGPFDVHHGSAYVVTGSASPPQFTLTWTEGDA